MTGNQVLIVSLLFLLFAMFFIVFSIVFNRRALKHKSTLRDLELSQKQDLLKATIDIQELERKRIGANIHDDLGPMLSTLKLQLAKLNQMITNEVHQNKIKESQNFIDDIIQYVRKVSRDLVPSILYELGLDNALDNVVERMTELFQGTIEYNKEGDLDSVPRNIQLAIYRIVQECLNNVLTHSQATHINLSVNIGKELLQLTIHDNGIGYNSKISHLGLGLKNIKARADALNGWVEFYSNSETGTKVITQIPLQDE